MSASAEDAADVRVGDMDAEEFRRQGYAVIDRIADYLQNGHEMPVLAPVSRGVLLDVLPAEAPSRGEPMEDILADYDRFILPATTHWNQPGFLAYFANSGSGPGILGEALAAGLNVNAMLWRTGPAATELEEVAVDWLRQMLGLSPEFEGVINDTASSSTLYALAAARELASDLHIREKGLAGRSDVPRLRVYCSEEAHSSVDKAVITLGLGLSGVRHIPTDHNYAMDADALATAIAEDRAAGIRPLAVVATVGTTSTTAIDPVPRIAEICEREDIWLHVDAAYGGPAAIVPEMRWILDGTERAHSIVVNPHKWLFVPMDCSILYTKRPELVRGAFSLTPEYLTTTDGDVKNLMDYGVSLGRRFRALKLWFVLRYFGVDGITYRLREHLRLARLFATWVDDAHDFQRLAPVRFSVVVFRSTPERLSEEQTDAHNAALMERLNATGEVFISHTRAKGRYALRVAIGNIRTAEEHVRRTWDLLQEFARA
jgi:aromatic-L-amino-acid/L-tryptophan decarboxylase